MTQDNEKEMKQVNRILGQDSGTVYGYGRVSTKEQNSARQKEVLQNKCDIYFEDKLSGKNMERPQFKEMFSLLKGGDTVVVVSIDRFGRNLKELVEFSSRLKEMGVNIADTVCWWSWGKPLLLPCKRSRLWCDLLL